MVSSPEVARVPKAELDRGRGRLRHFPSCSKENMPYENHLFQCHGEAPMMSLVASPRRQRPLQEPRGWIWYWGLVDRVTYVTDKAYAIRSTISPSTTQRRRGQRLRARPESPQGYWAGGMSSLVGHNACIMRQAHTSQESHLHVRIDTSNSSPKWATLPKSP